MRIPMQQSQWSAPYDAFPRHPKPLGHEGWVVRDDADRHVQSDQRLRQRKGVETPLHDESIFRDASIHTGKSILSILYVTGQIHFYSPSSITPPK